jgi:uncharacterized protein (DUF433 family)
MQGNRNPLLERISIDPRICGGKPCIKGTRIWVSLILDFLADDMTEAELLDQYPGLTHEDVLAAIAYGAEAARECVIPVPAENIACGTRNRASSHPRGPARSRARTPYFTRYAVAGRGTLDRRARAPTNPPSVGGRRVIGQPRAAAGALRLDGGRVRARHLGLLGGDELQARGARLRPLGHVPGYQDFSEDTPTAARNRAGQ